MFVTTTPVAVLFLFSANLYINYKIFGTEKSGNVYFSIMFLSRLFQTL